jgi:hypothetical protein
MLLLMKILYSNKTWTCDYNLQTLIKRAGYSIKILN